MSDQATTVETRRRARDVVLLTVGGVCSWLLARHVASLEVDAAVIPTLAVLATKHFKKGKQGKQEPKHPAVKFVLAAWNDGDFAEVEKHVAPDCAIYANGLAMDSGSPDSGAADARQSIEYWRSILPDLEMELWHEIRERDRIALEWLITGTHTGERPDLPASGNKVELQGSAFLTLEDDKIVEAWSVFDSLALAVQTGAAEAPPWWPGRQQAE